MTAPALLTHPEWTPADGEVVLVADWKARRDGYGRLMLSAWWWTDYIPDLPSGPHVRGQAFITRPEDHHDEWVARGYTVRVEQDVAA